jgi:molybdopterin synthase catalytic subunit
MIQITHQTIDTQQVLHHVRSSHAGAVVMFLGTAREFTEGRRSLSLDYECYPEMAATQLQALEDEARQRWRLVATCIVHRVGRVELGEVSVAIAVSAAHRQAAFEAGQWLIDRLKQVVPIWKQERFADGTVVWAHPGAPLNDGAPGDAGA